MSEHAVGRENQLASETSACAVAGIEFVEFTAPNPSHLAKSFRQLGFRKIARHRNKRVDLFRQHEVNFILNDESHSLASDFAAKHGTAVNAVCFRVDDVAKALNEAQRYGLEVIKQQIGPMELNIPAIRGVGDTLIYLVQADIPVSIYDVDFIFADAQENLSGPLVAIDHITQNVEAGHLHEVVRFYESFFGFKVIRKFDIKGQHSGLRSEALLSPCGTFRIALNEATEKESQINEFIERFHGEGVQHIALNTDDILGAVDQLRAAGVEFQSTAANYYDDLRSRLTERMRAQIPQLQKRHVLLDGCEDTGYLLQIFTTETVGPAFFELIQRQGNEGFGEGNFQALFESIERDQVSRGVFDAPN